MGPTMDPAPAYLPFDLLACIAAYLTCVAVHLGWRVVEGKSPCAIPAGGAALGHFALCLWEDGASWASPTTSAQSCPARRRPSLARDHLPVCGHPPQRQATGGRFPVSPADRVLSGPLSADSLRAARPPVSLSIP